MAGQPRGAQARELWEAARAGNPRPADPQGRVEGGPAAVAAAAAMMAVCSCGHPAVEHGLAERDAPALGITRGQRTRCSRMDAGGLCGCGRFTPRPIISRD